MPSSSAPTAAETAPPAATWPQRLIGHFAIGTVWVLHWLPLWAQHKLGRGLGSLLWHWGRSRRNVALRNLQLCIPRWTDFERECLAREHFALIGRSLIERGLLWFAPPARLKRIVKIRGNVQLAEQSERPVMWLLPHFVGLEWLGPALMLFQNNPGVDIYQPQSNPVLDAQILKGRSRFGQSTLVTRAEGIRPVVRLIKEGYGFVNAPDMDFGPKDSVFVPFFGVPACTLLAPSRMARSLKMIVQPVVVTLLPDGEGVDVHFCDPLPNYPTDDPKADAQTFNRWLETQIQQQPAQYFWVHRRFKTRPPGSPGVYR